MLSTSLAVEERITTAHRAKLAYVYVRQSSPGQVRHHQESTELQYRLVERVVLLGWPREQVLRRRTTFAWRLIDTPVSICPRKTSQRSIRILPNRYRFVPPAQRR